MEKKLVEELSLNHWQSLSTLMYDGWLLRFADGYTKRANSISPIYGSSLDLRHKIQECEKIYTANQLRTTFKITPFIHPYNLDKVLEEEGYDQIDLTSVQTRRLDQIQAPEFQNVKIDDRIDAEWIQMFCRLSGLKGNHMATIERMLSNIRTKKGFISLYHNKQVIACGFAVIERDYIGLYDIITDQSFRNQGFGEQMIRHLLQWGKDNGARSSYLAVVANNLPAIRLYEKLGYSEIYQYWYRVKDTYIFSQTERREVEW
ncbi:GNAT family N-acetyltransferase [Paenibacillus thermotolerans]|uniref:GNAT family N-acetyltransferase n=1 Tax=Paenibacillus thermotolerans TaxID=3027807 RepID=UPI0023689B88|nr:MULTISPECIES: GNAT family N-acetyltransferase [unclassified Paenibacillus]